MKLRLTKRGAFAIDVIVFIVAMAFWSLLFAAWSQVW